MVDQTEKKLNEGIRTVLDEQILQIKELGSSRERNIALTKIEEAALWLESDLRKKSSSDVEPEEFINPQNSDRLL